MSERTLTFGEQMQRWPLQTTAQHAPWLFGLLLDAPLMGVLQRWPNTLHAVTKNAVAESAFRGSMYESACGKRGLRLVDVGDGMAAVWPPSTRGLPEHLTRCEACWEATGRKRPRIRFRVRGSDE
jgi:hypothetical protein